MDTIINGFAYAMVSAINATRLYPAAHPAIETQTAQAWKRYQELAEDGSLIQMGLYDDLLFIQEQLFSNEPPAAKELVALMNQLEIEGLEFLPGLSQSMFSRLLLLFSEPDEEISFADQLIAKGISHVRLKFSNDPSHHSMVAQAIPSLEKPEFSENDDVEPGYQAESGIGASAPSFVKNSENQKTILTALFPAIPAGKDVSSSGSSGLGDSVYKGIGIGANRQSREGKQKDYLSQGLELYQQLQAVSEQLLYKETWRGDPDFSEATRLIRELLPLALADGALLYQLTLKKFYEQYTVTHTVNTVLLSVLLGRLLFMSAREQERLALISFFRGICRAWLDPVMLSKPGSLFYREKKALRNLDEKMVNLAEKADSMDSESVRILEELLLKKGGREASIIFFADVFDSLVSYRPYRKGLTPRQALLEAATDGSENLPIIIDYFSRFLGPWPPGSLVRLCSGAVVLVYSYSRHDNSWVLIPVFDCNGKRMQERVHIQLGSEWSGQLVAEVDPLLKDIDIPALLLS